MPTLNATARRVSVGTVGRDVCIFFVDDENCGDQLRMGAEQARGIGRLLIEMADRVDGGG